MFAPRPSLHFLSANGSFFPSIPCICPGCLELLGPFEETVFLVFHKSETTKFACEGS